MDLPQIAPQPEFAPIVTEFPVSFTITPGDVVKIHAGHQLQTMEIEFIICPENCQCIFFLARDGTVYIQPIEPHNLQGGSHVDLQVKDFQLSERPIANQGALERLPGENKLTFRFLPMHSPVQFD